MKGSIRVPVLLLGVLLLVPWTPISATECSDLNRTTIEIDAHQATAEIRLNPLLLKETGQRLNPTLLADKPWCGAFKPLADFDPSQLRGGDVFWLQLNLNFVDTGPDAWLLNLPVGGLNRACAHLPLIGAGYIRRCAGLAFDHDDWPLDSVNPAFPLPYQLDSKRPILVELQARHLNHIKATLTPAVSYLSVFHADGFNQGLFYGALLLMTLYCLAAFAAMGESRPLWYGLHLVCLTGALFGFSGLGYQKLWPALGQYASPFHYGLLLLSFAFGAQFVRHYLATAKHLPSLDRWLQIMFASPLLAIPAILIRPAASEPIVAVVSLLFLTLMFSAGLRCARRGDASARLLLISALAFSTGTTLVAISSLGLISLPPGLGMVVVRAGVVIGALAALAGLNYQLWLLRQQRDQAMANALAQSKIALNRAYHDEVTGLASRSRLFSSGSDRFTAAARQNRKLALFMIDLDQYGKLEKTLSTDETDLLARTLAKRLRRLVLGDELLSRGANDLYFLLVGEGASIPITPQCLTETALQIRQLVSEPILLGQQELRISATVGIALAPDHASNFEGLMTACKQAVIQGKQRGGNASIVFEPGVHDGSAHRNALQSELWGALEADQIIVHFQPMIEASSGKLLGYEALVRWLHPERGLIPPNQFLPAIEGTHLMVKIGHRVLELVCRQIQSWSGTERSQLKVAVNISAIELLQTDFTEALFNTLEQYQIDPGLLELELTESSLMENLDQAATVMAACRQRGIGTYIDDFGTGYSSLAYLRELPLTGVKIDRSFIKRIEDTDEDRAIVTTIIALAHNLGLTVVAEGVEEKTQERILLAQGCDTIQGYLHGAPRPIDDLPQNEGSPVALTASG